MRALLLGLLIIPSGCVFDQSGPASQDLASSFDTRPQEMLGERPNLLDLEISPDEGSAPAPEIAGGVDHGCAVRWGELWCWGANAKGQLGTGETTAQPRPARIGQESAWRHLAPGGQANHTCALKSDGSLWCWGHNQDGQLGLNDSGGGTDRLAPTQVTQRSWRSAARGQRHTCAVAVNDTLWCWGYNTEGQLGLGDLAERLRPTQVGSGATWQRVAPGDGHTCAIRSDGTLWCWGRNSQGQLGLGTGAALQYTLPQQVDTGRWLAVAGGQHHTCAIKQNGTLWCWGENSSSQLGLGDTVLRHVPTRVGTNSDWVEVATAWFHTCGIRSDGTLWCWGRNVEGQLGLGDILARSVPTQVPGTGWVGVAVSQFHTCAVRGDAAVWCTGDNDSGQLGQGDTTRRDQMTAVTF